MAAWDVVNVFGNMFTLKFARIKEMRFIALSKNENVFLNMDEIEYIASVGENKTKIVTKTNNIYLVEWPLEEVMQAITGGKDA